MRDSAGLNHHLDKSDGLRSAWQEIVSSCKRAAPATLVEGVPSRFRMDAEDGAAFSVVVEAVADAPEGAAVAALANLLEPDDDDFVEPATKRACRIRSRNRWVKRPLLSSFLPPFQVFLVLERIIADTG